MKGKSMQQGEWKPERNNKKISVIIVSEKSIRKLPKISQGLYFQIKQESFSIYLTAQESTEQELKLLPKQWLCTIKAMSDTGRYTLQEF